MTFQLWFNASAPGVLISELHSDPAGTAIAELFPDGILKVGLPGLPTISIPDVALNTWRQISLTYDTSSVFSAYLDGQPAGSVTGSRTELSTYIAALGLAGATNFGGGAAFVGNIDEFRAYSRALSPAEILRTYDKVVDTSNDGFQIAHWTFDKTVLVFNAPAVEDTCGRKNHGIQKPVGPINLATSTAPIVIDRHPIVTGNSAVNISPVEFEASGGVNGRGLPTTATLSIDCDGTNVAFIEATLAAVDAPQAFGLMRLTNLIVGVPYTQTVTASNAHGIATSTVPFSKNGWQGNAFHFEPDAHVQTSLTISQNQFYPTESITIELWFNPNKGGVLASEKSGPAMVDLLATGEVIAGFQGIEPVSLGQAKFNEWNHVALRYNHVSGDMQGFLNGVPSAVHIGDRITPAENGLDAQMSFGAGTAINFGGGEFYGGDMDEIRVWNVARSDAQLTEQRFLLLADDEPNLVLNWRFDHGTMDPVDFSLSGNNGRIRGGAGAILSTAPLRYAVQPIQRTDSQLTLEFLVNPGLTYKLERSADLGTWTTIETNTPSGGLLQRSQTFDPMRPGEFYRITQE